MAILSHSVVDSLHRETGASMMRASGASLALGSLLSASLTSRATTAKLDRGPASPAVSPTHQAGIESRYLLAQSNAFSTKKGGPSDENGPARHAAIPCPPA